MEVSSQLQDPADIPQGRNPVLLNRGVGGSQSWSEHFEKEKKF
jgi:hypothetical protein